MRNYYLLLLFISGITLLSACNKDLSAPTNNNKPANAIKPGTTVSITREQAAILNELMKTGKVKSVAGFFAKVDSLKSLTAQKNAGVNSASHARTAGVQGYDYSWDYTAGATYGIGDAITLYGIVATTVLRYRTSFHQYQTYQIRQNTILIKVPFRFDWDGANILTIWFDPDYSIELLPYDGSWGDVAQGNSYILSGSADPTGFCGITAQGDAVETRTEIVSTSGAVKISTDTNVNDFTPGATLEPGFIIQNAFNVYNNYSMSATGQIYPGNRSVLVPQSIYFVGTISCDSYGIQENQ